jgi:glucose/arabinose dehydrogenase
MRRVAFGLSVLLATLVLALPASAQICDGISTASGSNLTAVRVASGLSRPVLAVSPPGDAERLFIVEQTGLIRILEGGVVNPTAFLDLTATTRNPNNGGGNEEGLLGLAFHPDYHTNGWFFVLRNNLAGNIEILRFTRDTPTTANETPTPVLTISHPTFTNHNGGMIAFSPVDGALYIAVGDGGGGCDSTGSAQDQGDMRGKMLRIDVDSLPYSLPTMPDNPFDGAGDPLDEIWALGLRNPWRFSFDSLTGDLYIGDVGQGDWEEIDYQPASSTGGENYGWPIYEGNECPPPACGGGSCVVPFGHTPPVLEFESVGACAVSGGFVYRGCRMPDIHGRYFYGDYCAEFVRSFVIQGGVAKDPQDHTTELAPGGGQTIEEITGFGQDGRGELYVLDRGVFNGGNGEVYQIVPVFTAMELSGAGAVPLLPGFSFTWEDLTTTSPHPLTLYRVYRHDGNGSGTFDCVHQTGIPSWPGGDLDLPLFGELYSYITTAVNPDGDETSPGESSAGVPRSLSAAACP